VSLRVGLHSLLVLLGLPVCTVAKANVSANALVIQYKEY